MERDDMIFTIEVLVWNGERHVKEHEEKGYIPAIPAYMLNVKNWDITDVNVYPALQKVTIFAQKRKEAI